MDTNAQNAAEDLLHYQPTRSWLIQFDKFASEVKDVFENVVTPQMEYLFDSRPFEFMLRAYILHCFTWIDWCSQYWSRSNDQTKRMTAFMRCYIQRDGAKLDGKTANVAVNLWRHPLAHGPFLLSRPNRTTWYDASPQWRAYGRSHWRIAGYADQPAHDPTTGEEFAMSDEERREAEERQVQLDTLRGAGRTERHMTLGLLELIADVRGAMERYIEELDTTPRLQELYEERWQALNAKEF